MAYNTLSDLPLRPVSLLVGISCHLAFLALIQSHWPQGFRTGCSLCQVSIWLAPSPPPSLSLFKYHFPSEGCSATLFKINLSHTYTHTHTLSPSHLPPLAGHILYVFICLLSVSPNKESELHENKDFCLFCLPTYSQRLAQCLAHNKVLNMYFLNE